MRKQPGRPRVGTSVEFDKDFDRSRQRVSQYVRRNGIDKSCIICGKEGKILHNRENPYIISFICDECSKKEENLKIAEKSRRDIREQVDKRGTHLLTTGSSEFVIEVIEEYLRSTLPIREYCAYKKISNRQFHVLVEGYKELYPTKPVDDMIRNHRNKVHRFRIQEDRAKI